MNKFFSSIGRFGNIALHVGILAAQAYTITAQNGKVRWDNLLIGFIQLLAADRALQAQPPKPAPSPEPPKG